MLGLVAVVCVYIAFIQFMYNARHLLKSLYFIKLGPLLPLSSPDHMVLVKQGSRIPTGPDPGLQEGAFFP